MTSSVGVEGVDDPFRAAFADAPIGMTLVDLDGRFLVVNRSTCRITGFGEQELLTKTYQDITHPDDLEVDVAYAKAVRAGERASAGLSGVFREVGLVTRHEWEELELRLAQVEHRLRLVETPPDEQPTSPGL